MDYLNLGADLDMEDYLFAIYSVNTDLPLQDAANRIAEEQTTGTWLKTTTLSDDIMKRLGGQVTEVNEVAPKKGIVTIAYPVDLFSIEIGTIPQILSIIAGNLFGLSSLKKVRLMNISIPPLITSKFKGPNFGIPGMRNILGRPEQPLIGTIVKPKVGLSPEQTADYIYQCGIGGLTNSKDDETLVDQSFCPLKQRVPAIAEAIDKVRSETGRNMLHATNISTRTDQIVDVARNVIELGANQVMVDVITCGYDAVQALSEADLGVPIHVHRTMHAAFTRDPEHGIDMKVIAQLVRLCGGDALHIGSFGVGKMSSHKEIELEIKESLIEETGLLPVMPVCSGGLHPGCVERLVHIGGKDLQIQAGGGVAGHPDGILAGAKAMAQAVNSVAAGVPLDMYAKDWPELNQALELWGYVK